MKKELLLAFAVFIFAILCGCADSEDCDLDTDNTYEIIWAIEPQYAFAGAFSSGFAVVEAETASRYFIDKSGDSVFNKQFSYIYPNTDRGNFIDYTPVVIEDGLANEYGLGINGDSQQTFHDPCEIFENDSKGLYISKSEDEKYGFINHLGQWVIPPEYDNADITSDGLLKAEVGSYRGFINDSLEWVKVERPNAFIESFSNGLARVSFSPADGSPPQYNFIDSEGRIVFENDFEYAFDYSGESIERVTPKKYEGKFLTVSEGNSLLAIAKGKPIETAIILAMVYGLRRSEVAGLKWDAVDFDNNLLHIRHTVVRQSTMEAKDRTKNKSSKRTLPLDGIVKDHLLEIKAQQEKDRDNLPGAYVENNYVCRWADGRAMNCDYITRGFKNLLKKTSLPNIRFHDLRHSCASYLLKGGCNMKEVSEWLGHSEISTTMDIYAHLDFDSKKETAKKASQIFAKDNS